MAMATRTVLYSYYPIEMLSTSLASIIALKRDVELCEAS